MSRQSLTRVMSQIWLSSMTWLSSMSRVSHWQEPEWLSECPRHDSRQWLTWHDTLAILHTCHGRESWTWLASRHVQSWAKLSQSWWDASHVHVHDSSVIDAWLASMTDESWSMTDESWTLSCESHDMTLVSSCTWLATLWVSQTWRDASHDSLSVPDIMTRVSSWLESWLESWLSTWRDMTHLLFYTHVIDESHVWDTQRVMTRVSSCTWLVSVIDTSHVHDSHVRVMTWLSSMTDVIHVMRHESCQWFMWVLSRHASHLRELFRVTSVVDVSCFISYQLLTWVMSCDMSHVRDSCEFLNVISVIYIEQLVRIEQPKP